MPEAGLIYSNARIKSMERSLVGSAQLSRLLDADSVGDAFKLLVEFGYGNGISIDDKNAFENLIAYERTQATEFFKENVFKSSGLENLLKREDYHNLKAAIKAFRTGQENPEAFYPSGNIDKNVIVQAVLSGDCSALPVHMRNAIQSLDPSAGPRQIDVAVDKALYSDVFASLKKCNQKIVKEYFVKQVDLKNISAFVRVNLLGLGFAFFNEGFIEGGSLDIGFYESFASSDVELFADKLRTTDYKDIAEKCLIGKKDLVLFEKVADDILLDVFRKERNDMFSVAPIAGYYLAKCTELKVVNTVVSAIKNGIDKKLLAKRLRELYA